MKSFFLLSILFMFSSIYGQNYNIYDPNFNLFEYTNLLKINLSLSDEFNNPTLDELKWKKKHNPDGNLYPQYVSIVNGALNIKYNDSKHTGAVETIQNNYHYGYYEARYQIPFYLKSDGSRSNKGLYNVFWLNHDTTYPADWKQLMSHDEIDQFEALDVGTHPDSTLIWFQGIHIMRRPSRVVLPSDENNNWQAMQSAGYSTIYPEDLSNDFHVYGLLYLPNEMHFYIDGNEINSITSNYSPIYEHDFFPIHPLNVLFNCDISKDINLPNWPTDPPIYKIDYFRYFEYVENRLKTKTLNNLSSMQEFSLSNPYNGVYSVVKSSSNTSAGFDITLPIHPSSTYPIGYNEFNGELFVPKTYYDPYEFSNLNYLIRAGQTIIKPLTKNSKFKVPPGANFQVVPTKCTNNTPIVNNPTHLLKFEQKEQKFKSSIVNVSPNPATSNLEIVSNSYNIVSFQIISVEGLIILDKFEKSKAVHVNVEPYAKGCYFLRILLENNEQVIKKIILK